jgi:transposase
MKKSVKFSPEAQERALRMVVEAQGQRDSQWAAIELTAAKIGCTAATLRRGSRRLFTASVSLIDRSLPSVSEPARELIAIGRMPQHRQ